jgi:ribulose kinase
MRIITDVTGRTLQVPRVPDAGALGAAILAAVGVGLYRNDQEAAEALIETAKRYEPHGTQHKYYDRVYEVFTELENGVAPLYGRVPVV